MLPLTVAVLFIASSAILLRKDFDKLPKLPVRNESRTWPLDEHWARVYGTFFETAPVYGLLIAGFVVGAFGINNEKRIRAKSAAKGA